jgi:hypothetical protein
VVIIPVINIYPAIVASFPEVVPLSKYNQGMFDWFLKKKKLPVSGVSIVLLQQRLDRFSTERLNEAMQRSWRREYEPQKFFAVSIFDGEAAVLKVGSAFYFIRHFDRWLGPNELGDVELPPWAMHKAYSAIGYECPGGVPKGELRTKMYGFLGLLCAELLTTQTVGIFFSDEHLLFQNDPELCKRLRSGCPLFT